MQPITLELELNEINVLLDLMGAQPTNTNIWPLAHKIRSQAAAQLDPQKEGQVCQSSSQSQVA